MIPTGHPHLVVAALSHPGETGKNNEDCFSVTSYHLEADGTPALLALVTDGIGGHRAGEVAARLTADTIVRSLAESSGQDPVPQLKAAVIDAARAVSRSAQESPDRAGMGSTAAVAWIIGPRLYAVYVGDSRIYLLRHGELRQVSVDHTWVQEAIDHGVIAPEEARNHPHAHVLRRHLGGQLEPQPDTRLRLSPDESDEQAEANQGVSLDPGDQILLCSDGLTDLVQDGEMEDILLSSTPAAAAQALIDLARSRGGFDNITAIVMALPVPARRRSARGCLLPLAAALAGGTALVALVTLGLALIWQLGYWPWSAGGAPPTLGPSPTAASAQMETQAALTPTLIQGSPSTTPLPSVTVAPTATFTPIPLPTVPIGTP